MVTSPTDADPLAQFRSTPAFLSVWLPSVLAIIGTGACLFTVGWWLSTTEQGGAAVGTVIGVSSLISLTTNAAFSGSVDRGDRQRLAAGLLGAALVPVALTAFLMQTQQTQQPPALVLVLAGACYALISALETLFLGTCETTAADLAPAHWPLTRIALLTQIHSQVDRIIAPVFAGMLIGRNLPAMVPLVAVILLVLVIVSTVAARHQYQQVTEVRVRAAGTGNAGGSPLKLLFSDAGAAVGLVRRSGPLSYLVIFGMLGNLVVFPFYAILPAFLLDYVPAGPESGVWAGRAAAAYGIGMLVVGAGLLRSRRHLHGNTGIGAASLALALICLIIGAVTFAPSPPWVVAALGATGGLFSILTAVGGAIWLEHTPPAVRARVFSFRRLTVFSTIPLGTLLIGFGGQAVGYAVFTRWLALAVLVGLGLAWARYERRRRCELQAHGDK